MNPGSTHTPSTPADMPEASILVVGYRSKPYIERCIAGAIRASEGESVEILFLDCSDDGSEALVRERFPTVRILPYQGNLGFARGNNVLAREARGRSVILLNPDAFAERNEISALMRLSREHPDAEAWAGITVLPDGSIDGGSIQPMLGALPLALALVGLARLRPGAAKLNVSRPQSVPVLTGAFMMVRAATWHRLGGFDERFFMYAEEVDLCKRIADGGGTLLCDPRIRMLHDTGSGDRRAASRLLNLSRGNATFYTKHYGPFWAHVCRILLLTHALTRFAFGVLSGSRGHRDGFGAVMWKRRDWWHGWPPRDPAAEAS
jgi:N-acetylglucosaminyl-diphospho-decaprenol L-rhamnosyltransferase